MSYSGVSLSNINSSVTNINNLIGEYNTKRRDEIISEVGLGCALLSGFRIFYLGSAAVVFSPTIVLVSQVALICLLSIVAVSSFYARRQHAIEIDKKVNILFENGVDFEACENHLSIEDQDFTKEQFERMKPYCNYDYHHFKYYYESTYAVHIEKPSYSFFKAMPMNFTHAEKSSTLQKQKERYKPWRELLEKMTRPENCSRVNTTELEAIGLMTYSGDATRKLLGVGDRWPNPYYRVDRKSSDQLSIYSNQELFRNCKTPEEFLDYLKANYKFALQDFLA